MNHLLRSLAPISDSGWEVLEEEARERLKPALAARRLVDFSGPHGWEHSATNLGRVEGLGGQLVEGVSGARRRVLPLVELRADFALSRNELRDTDRGADDGDWAPLDDAAHRLATAENVAVFHGWDPVFEGIAQLSPYESMPLAADAGWYPQSIARAVELLLQSGIGGPYGLALGAEQYRAAIGSAESGGYPVLEHLRLILEGPVVWAPGV